MDSQKISFSGKFAQVPPPPPPWLVNGVRPSTLLKLIIASEPQRLSKSSCSRGGLQGKPHVFPSAACTAIFFDLLLQTDYWFLAESGNKKSAVAIRTYIRAMKPRNHSELMHPKGKPLGNFKTPHLKGFVWRFLRSRRHVRTNKEIEKVKWLICVNSFGKVLPSQLTRQIFVEILAGRGVTTEVYFFNQ